MSFIDYLAWALFVFMTASLGWRAVSDLVGLAKTKSSGFVIAVFWIWLAMVAANLWAFVHIWKLR